MALADPRPMSLEKNAAWHSLFYAPFDNLPDSYFSPKEWEKFLKLRGNEMWINIAIECSEFRIEHKEEYEKCSNMLQAIMDNRSLE